MKVIILCFKLLMAAKPWTLSCHILPDR